MFAHDPLWESLISRKTRSRIREQLASKNKAPAHSPRDFWLLDKGFEISNLELIKDMVRIRELENVVKDLLSRKD